MKLGINLPFFSFLRLENDPRICTCKASCLPLSYILQPWSQGLKIVKLSQGPILITSMSLTIPIKLVQILQVNIKQSKYLGQD